MKSLLLLAMIFAGYKIMKSNPNVLNLEIIKAFESFSSEIYQDIAGYDTIGYGHLIKPGESFISLTENQATVLLMQDAQIAMDAVNDLVTVQLSDNQFNALVSFTFNVGVGALSHSTLLSVLNQGDYDNAASEFERWKYAGGEVIQGLINRRATEKALFLA